MQCVVTGAAGFIGSWLSHRLLERGYSVLGIDCFTDYYSKEVKLRNLKSLSAHSGFSFVSENLANCDVGKLVHGAQLIFHQAAQAGVRASWGKTFASYCEHNIMGTQRLLEAALKLNTLKKIVFASSSSVYGDAETFPTSETVTPKPVSPYGVTKLASEHLMCLYAREFNVPTVSLRYFTVFGPRQRPDMAFHRFIRAALTKQEITLYGDGEQTRDFTFISDIVEANILAAEQGKNGEVYNLGGGTRSSVNEVLDIIGSHLGKLRIDRQNRVAGDALHTSADTSKATRDLGFKPKVSLKQGLLEEIAWLEGEIREGF